MGACSRTGQDNVGHEPFNVKQPTHDQIIRQIFESNYLTQIFDAQLIVCRVVYVKKTLKFESNI